MKSLFPAWLLLVLLPAYAWAQQSERIQMGGKTVRFEPVPDKYVLFLAPGQSAANAKIKATSQVQGLKVLNALPSPSALVVMIPAQDNPAARTSGAFAQSIGGQALRPVYTYDDGTEEAPTGAVAVRFSSRESLQQDLAGIAASVGAVARTSKLDATLAFLDVPATANPFEIARRLQGNPKLFWAEPDMLKFLRRPGQSMADPAAKKTAKTPAPPAPMAPSITLPNDALLSQQWYLHNNGRVASHYWNNSDVKAFEAWEVTQGSSSIKVAIIDEGVDLNHPDLQSQLLPGYDAIDEGTNGGPINDDAHGTACAGIVAGKAGNGIGVSGIAPNCKIVPVRIAYGVGSGWATSNEILADGLMWAWKVGQADVLSNSWGGGSPSSLIHNAIDSAAIKGRGGKGAPVLFSAGNNNSAGEHWPSAYSTCIGVNAMSMCDERKNPGSCDDEDWWGSNYGQNGDVSAPGVKMVTLDISGTAGYDNSDYAPAFNGTSSACPAAAGVMALILSQNPDMSEQQARTLLETTCDKVGTYTYNTGVSGQPNGSWSTDLGYGRVNALRALSTAADASLSNVLTLDPATGFTGPTVPISYFSSFGCNAAVPYVWGERVLRFFARKGYNYTFTLSQAAGNNDLYLLSRFHKDSCLAYSAQNGTATESINITSPSTGWYYLVVKSTLGFPQFNLTVTPGPGIASVNPTNAAWGQFNVIVRGVNFTTTPVVKVNGTVAKYSSGNTPEFLNITIPYGSTSGYITVTTPVGTAVSSQFVVVRPWPIITGFSPPTAQAGDFVTVTGQNFGTLELLRVGDEVAEVTNLTQTTATFKVPEGATTSKIIMRNDAGSDTSANTLIITPTLLSCGQTVSGNNAFGSMQFGQYSCTSWNESGPEAVYRFKAEFGTSVTATLSNLTADLDIFLLSARNPDSCLAVGNNAITYTFGRDDVYYIVVDGYQGATSNFSLTVSCTGECFPRSNCITQDGYINKFILYTLDNRNTGCNEGSGRQKFQPVGSQTTTLVRGGTYPFTVSVYDYSFAMKTALWIDYNGDGDFNDAKEMAFSDAQTLISTSGNFTVPTWAHLGPVKLRVRKYWHQSGGNPTLDSLGSCTDRTMGETEDYVVTIEEGLVPNITSFTPVLASIGDTVTVTGSNFLPLNSLKLGAVNQTVVSTNPDGTSLKFKVAPNSQSNPITIFRHVISGQSATNLNLIRTLACGDSVTGTNTGGTNLFTTYSCFTNWTENGPERIYKINGEFGMKITATLSNLTADLDIFLIRSLDQNTCVAYGNSALVATLEDGVYYLVVDGYQGAVSNFSLKLSCLNNCYATSRCATDYIKDFYLNTLANTNTGCNNSSMGRTRWPESGTTTTTLEKGKTYSYTLNFEYFSQKSAIWIDYNGDGDFNDAKEQVMVSNTQTDSKSGTITVPAWAVTGRVKLRARCSYNVTLDSTSACLNSADGETEDYVITLAEPQPTIYLTGVDNTCQDTDSEVRFTTIAIAAGSAYQVYVSKDGANFTNRPTAYTDISATFPSTLTMDAWEDSIRVYVYVSTGGVNSDTITYWQYNNGHGPLLPSSYRCGPGTITATLNLPASFSVEWYDAPSGGNLAGTGFTLTLENQTGNSVRYAHITNGNGCTSTHTHNFTVFTQPVITSWSPLYAGPGKTVTLHGSGFSEVFFVSHGGATTEFSVLSDTEMEVLVPNGASDGTIAIQNIGACSDTTGLIPVEAPNHWPITFGAQGDDFVRGLVRDTAGNIYASLSFQGTIDLQGTSIASVHPGKRNAMLAKFDKHGNLLWYTQMGNSVFNMEPRGVNVDGEGNPYWAGSFAGTVTLPGNPPQTLVAAGSYDAYTARFDPATGACLWARRVGGAGNDYLYGCFVSNSGNVYAGGSYTGAITFSSASGPIILPNAGGLDGFIVKYDSMGTGIWANHVSSAADDEVKAMEYMGGDLVACGYMGNNAQFGPNTLPSLNGLRDGWAARINSVGQYIWVKNFGSMFNDEATGITVDRSTGNVFVTAQVADAPMVFNGQTLPGYGGNDIVVAGWNFYTQNPVWARRAGSPSGDSPAEIRWDGQDLVMAGYSQGTMTLSSGQTLAGNGAQDGILLHYRTADGVVAGARSIGGAGNDRLLAITLDKATRNIYAGGRHASSVAFPDLANPPVPRVSNGGAYDGFICRVSPPASANRAGLELSGLRAWPNPVRNSLSVVSEETGPIQLFDARGRLHATLHAEADQAATLQVSHLPTGLYLLRQGSYTLHIVVE